MPRIPIIDPLLGEPWSALRAQGRTGLLPEIALLAGVLLRQELRHDHRPRALDEVAHLLRVDRAEADVDPVEPHVGLARQRELLRLRVDGGLTELLRESAADPGAVGCDGEVDDLADPELH